MMDWEKKANRVSDEILNAGCEANMKFKGETAVQKVIEIAEKELAHFRKTRIPRCFYCHKPFVNGVDSKTKKVSKYLWVPTCECVKNIEIYIG